MIRGKFTSTVAAFALLSASIPASPTTPLGLTLFGQAHLGLSVIDLNFAKGPPYYLKGATGPLTEARSTPATAFDANNNLVTCAAFVPCVVGGKLWVYEARTNLFLNSNAPATQTITVVSGSVYTVSFYGTGTLTLSGAATQTMTGSAYPAQTVYSFVASSTSLTATVTVLGGMQYPQVELNPSATTAAQAFPTPPIQTGATSVARNASQVSLATQSCANPSILAIGTPSAPIAYVPDQVLAEIDDGTINNLVSVKKLGITGAAVSDELISGVFTRASSGANWTTGTSAKLSQRTTSTTNTAVFNNSSTGSSSPSGVLTLTHLLIGQSTYALNYWNGGISRVALACGSSLTGY